MSLVVHLVKFLIFSFFNTPAVCALRFVISSIFPPVGTNYKLHTIINTTLRVQTNHIDGEIYQTDVLVDKSTVFTIVFKVEKHGSNN